MLFSFFATRCIRFHSTAPNVSFKDLYFISRLSLIYFIVSSDSFRLNNSVVSGGNDSDVLEDGESVANETTLSNKLFTGTLKNVTSI